MSHHISRRSSRNSRQDLHRNRVKLRKSYVLFELHILAEHLIKKTQSNASKSGVGADETLGMDEQPNSPDVPVV